MKVKTVSDALKVFEQNALEHERATNDGDYKLANKSHSRIMKAIKFLKEADKVDLLDLLLDHESLGVRSWAALYLLPICEEKAIDVLEEVAKDEGIRGLAAKTTIIEWRKGNLEV